MGCTTVGFPGSIDGAKKKNRGEDSNGGKGRSDVKSHIGLIRPRLGEEGKGGGVWHTATRKGKRRTKKEAKDAFTSKPSAGSENQKEENSWEESQ